MWLFATLRRWRRRSLLVGGLIAATLGGCTTTSDSAILVLDPATATEHLSARLGPMGRFLAIHYAAVAAGDFAEVTDAVPTVTGRPARSLADLVAESPEAWRASLEVGDEDRARRANGG